MLNDRASSVPMGNKAFLQTLYREIYNAITAHSSYINYIQQITSNAQTLMKAHEIWNELTYRHAEFKSTRITDTARFFKDYTSKLDKLQHAGI
ncbi:MAG: hypothetical protein AB8B66_06245 [Rickettsiaceae bacterium]